MNQKKKGNAGEHAVAHFLEKHGIKAFRNSMSGGSIWKGDIANNLGLTIEVKTVKKLNLQQAWRQVESDSSKSHGTPVLFVRFDKMPKDSWLVVMESSDWVEQLATHS
jgi:Holliday junction resolvase